MKLYIKDAEERQLIIIDILKGFDKKTVYKYKLSDQSFLILTQDERKTSNLRRYTDSPFPLLMNLEEYSISLGDWNKEMLKHGLKCRAKLKDPGLISEAISTQIKLIYYNSPSSKGNHYLKRQYKRLARYRQTN